MSLNNNNNTNTSSFRILSFNTLNPNLCDDDPVKGFPYAPKKALVWEYRQGLYQQLFPTLKSDISCLVEVPSFAVPFYNSLHPNFKSLFLEKSNKQDGLLFLYDPKKFEVKESIQAMYDKGPQCYQINVLNHLPTKRELIVAMTHLKAKEEYEEERLKQVNILVKAIENVERKYTDAEIIVCGDFNDTPESECINEFLKKSKLLSVFRQETTYKYRQNKEGVKKLTARQIDFIFISNQLHVSNKSLELPPQLLLPDGLPNLQYPSDHSYLWCDLAFY